MTSSPSLHSASSASAPPASEEDWVCPHCAFHNAGEVELCNRCGGKDSSASSSASSEDSSSWIEASRTRHHGGNHKKNGKYLPSSPAVVPPAHHHQQFPTSVPSPSFHPPAHLHHHPQHHQMTGPLNHHFPTPPHMSNHHHLSHGGDFNTADQRRDPRLGQNADEEERRATDEGRKVFVGNLKRPITRQEVVDHFSRFGEVERVILNSGFGLVLMATREGALNATVERWQALGWRNVEVFVYTKGAKGASWNRPYTVPPRPGPCSLCKMDSAEHCTLCTSTLCLNETTTCASCCQTCQRSFCGGKQIDGGKPRDCGSKGLDKCDSCGALTCIFCALRHEAHCGQCGRLFTARLQENAKKQAERLVNARISENDGSVYALVCLLKSDVESSREGQLVAAIDRASKCFDPKANSWCTLTALRAIKELDEAWEATRRVHNLRALRRSAKQWSTDLTALALPVMHLHQQHPQQHTSSPSRNNGGGGSFSFPPSYSVHQQISLLGARHTAAAAAAPSSPGSYKSSPMPQSQQQQPLPAKLVGGEDLLFAALRASETFLSELDARPKTETDWLIANLKNTSYSVTKNRSSKFVEELCQRMDVWGMLLRRLSGDGALPAGFSSFPSLMNPLNRLKRAIVDVDTFYLHCKTKEEYMLRKDSLLLELIRAAREFKRSSTALASPVQSDMLLKRAGRTARNVDIRAMLVMAGVLPFDACLHHTRYHRCAVGVAACPFTHYSEGGFPAVQDREFDVADYEFSNDVDDLSLAVSASVPRPVASNPSGAVVSPAAVGWTPVPPSWPLSSSIDPGRLTAPHAFAATPAVFGPLPPPGSPPMQASLGLSDWPSAIPGKGAPPLSLSTVVLPQQKLTPFAEPADIVLQVAGLCEELGVEGSLVTQITAAFFASGAINHVQIWDTDAALLYKELAKIPSLPAAVRVKILNLVTERRVSDLLLPSTLAALEVPPLL